MRTDWVMRKEAARHAQEMAAGGGKGDEVATGAAEVRTRPRRQVVVREARTGPRRGAVYLVPAGMHSRQRQREATRGQASGPSYAMLVPSTRAQSKKGWEPGEVTMAIAWRDSAVVQHMRAKPTCSMFMPKNEVTGKEHAWLRQHAEAEWLVEEARERDAGRELTMSRGVASRARKLGAASRARERDAKGRGSTAARGRGAAAHGHVQVVAADGGGRRARGWRT